MKKTVYHGGRFGKDSAWFSDNPKVAGGFGKITWDNYGIPQYDDYESYEIEYNNPFIMDAKGENWLDIKTPKKLKPYWSGETIDSNGIVDICKKLGYDCIIIKNIEEGTTGAIGTDYCLLNGKYKNINESLTNLISLALDESLNERLEKMGDCFCTTSAYDVVNLLKNKPKDYRILYDRNIGYYFIGDGESVTHWDMLQKAYRDAYYYNMEDFIDSLGAFENYVEVGQDGSWDDDNEIEPYLYYIVFSPDEEWELGTDGYNKRYDYPFGHVFTRGCDLSEIDLWDALGVPENSEKLNESVDTLNDAFWKWFGKSKMIKNGQPIVFYHRTNAVFDVFDKDFSSPLLADGFYFSTKPLSEWYGKNMMKVYLKIENPYIIEDMQNLNSVAKFVKDFSLLTEDIKNTLQNYSDEYRSNPNVSYNGKAAL